MREIIEDLIIQLQSVEPNDIDKKQFEKELLLEIRPEEIKEIIESTSYKIREALAKSPSLSDECLEILAKDERIGVRELLIFNPIKKPIDVLLELANDNAPMVRMALAGSKNLPKEVKEVLAKDSEGFVRNTLITEHVDKGGIPVEILYAVDNFTFNQRHKQSYDGFELMDSNSWNWELVIEVEKNLKSKKHLTTNSVYPHLDRKCVSLYGWRTAGEKRWQLFGKDTGGYFSTNMTLFKNIDGFFKAEVSTQGKVLVISGAIKKEYQYKQMWFLQSQLEKIDFIKTETKFQFPDAEKILGKEGREVNLVGQAIGSYGVFALWGYQGKPVGWTQEKTALISDRKRIIKFDDLAPEKDRETFSNMEECLRAVVGGEVHL